MLEHENQTFPLSLSENGTIRPVNQKSDVLPFIQKDIPHSVIESPVVDAKVFDGGAIINMLSPREGKTFSDYANKILLPFIEAHLRTANRLDVVCDRYFPNSLTNTTREKRGSGVRRKVTSNGPLPVNWSTFLRCSENKLELLSFLTAELTHRIKNNILVMADCGNVYSNGVLDLNNLIPCDIEEADERIFLHVKHIAQEYHKILIKTVDSDVVVALSVFHRVLGISELWVEFGTGKNIRYIPIHQVASDIILVKC